MVKKPIATVQSLDRIYMLSMMLISDIDECATNGYACTCNGMVGCTALCTNNAGSYTCGCSDPLAFYLDADGFTCSG
jgi:hypothetical protein